MSHALEFLGLLNIINRAFLPGKINIAEIRRRSKLDSEIPCLNLHLRMSIQDNNKFKCVIWSKHDNYPVTDLFCHIPPAGWRGDKGVLEAFKQVMSLGFRAQIEPRTERDETHYIPTVKGDLKLVLSEF